MSHCIFDFGMFNPLSAKTDVLPTEHDYVLHLTFGLLIECCSNDNIPPIISRVILNNLTIKLNDKEIVLEQPKH